MHRSTRNGVSALDVIVTIVILLVLAALLLPATRGTRNPARRSQCKNNLKQFGLSLMNYHDVHRTFPPGWIASETKGQSSGFGWQFHILPFFDQAPLFKKFNSKQKLSDATGKNAELASTILAASRCPSDPGPDQVKSRWIPLLGPTNYVGNFGVGIPITHSVTEESAGSLVDPRIVQGIMGANSRVRIRDVKDGMSNVVLVGERRLSTDGIDWPSGSIEGNYNSYWAGIPDIDSVSPLVIVATVTGGLIEKYDENDPLYPLGNLKALDSAVERNALPYFGINRDFRGSPLRTNEGKTDVTAGFSSWHAGGCQFVLGDGTVRFLSESIDPIVFTNLMRRSDGQTLGEF